MPAMRIGALLVLLLTAPHLQAQSALTAAEIMARVAANQDRAEAERARYTYVQHADVASRKGKAVRCEEITDTRVTPQPAGSQRELLSVAGRLLVHGKYETYTALSKRRTDAEKAKTQTEASESPADESKDQRQARRKTERELRKQERDVEEDSDTDRDLVENLRKNLTDDKSRDGLAAGLFPLTSRAQASYDFNLKGRERRNGRETLHIAFSPRDRSDFGWRGDAWIDTEAFQPVIVQTAMARNIPFAVRTLLGTSVPGLGFSATYAAQPDGMWFPVSFGSEFKINVLFFFHRSITMSLENRDFQRTHVTSRIVGEPAQVTP